jgi:hypothetical protein
MAPLGPGDHSYPDTAFLKSTTHCLVTFSALWRFFPYTRKPVGCQVRVRRVCAGIPKTPTGTEAHRTHQNPYHAVTMTIFRNIDATSGSLHAPKPQKKTAWWVGMSPGGAVLGIPEVPTLLFVSSKVGANFAWACELSGEISGESTDIFTALSTHPCSRSQSLGSSWPVHPIDRSTQAPSLQPLRQRRYIHAF